ncbi:MAG: tRNA preQ1(34) S-adenosylmethionine ribosyltransferase-isomerase QueA [Clostridiales bacterium]|nr:tRNA preQ1(34) S-adenosylmethionine ribosyltransferase-isomerase QueA [Clostridiales bacterium]
MKTSDFDYYLPENLIAQSPCEVRSDSRLLVLDKKTGAVEHRKFTDITDYLQPNDCVAVNNTRVIPARLLGLRAAGGAAEALLLKRVQGNVWEALVRPGRRIKRDTRMFFGDGMLEARVLEVLESGNRLLEFTYSGIWEEVLDKLGEMPLPPYITTKLTDKERYQTVYAKYDGSAAAPTAGLHFTPELLEKIRAQGVNTAEITLHVGLGTFRPVKANDVSDHKMHSEYFDITPENARIVRKTTGSLVAVGTTTVRTLETLAKSGGVRACSGWTDIFIYPPYEFLAVDRLITNFHLPKSTLLMLVSSFAGRENVLNAYNEAIREKYRFFTFGDAMFIK